MPTGFHHQRCIKGKVACTCDPSARDTETGGSGVQDDAKHIMSSRLAWATQCSDAKSNKDGPSQMAQWVHTVVDTHLHTPTQRNKCNQCRFICLKAQRQSCKAASTWSWLSESSLLPILHQKPGLTTTFQVPGIPAGQGLLF